MIRGSVEVNNKLKAASVLVTGGAGFIGSHLTDVLMTGGCKVHLLDNLSSGSIQNIEHWLREPRFTFTKGDLLQKKDWAPLKECEVVFHFAANPEVRLGSSNPEVHYQQNIQATFNLLEAMRKSEYTSTFVFASSSTVYGDATQIPTSEDYAPLMPISVYGATKLACEAMITAYAQTYGFKAVIFRLANIIGPRSKHGVIFDFIQKLHRDPERLEVLGDGTQSKSYLHIDDCIDGILLALEKSNEKVTILNVGSEEMIDVKTIAKIILEEMRLHETLLIFTGGVDGGRGWKGDVKTMLLGITCLKSLGWKAKRTSIQAVRDTARNLLEFNH